VALLFGQVAYSPDGSAMRTVGATTVARLVARVAIWLRRFYGERPETWRGESDFMPRAPGEI
jgi:hypothetical protein